MEECREKISQHLAYLGDWLNDISINMADGNDMAGDCCDAKVMVDCIISQLKDIQCQLGNWY